MNILDTATLNTPRTGHKYLDKEENELLERAATGKIERQQANELVADLMLRLARLRECEHMRCRY